MIVAAAPRISGAPEIATWPPPFGTASMWKPWTAAPGSEAAHTTPPPSSSSRPEPTPPCAPQPSSAASLPSRSRTASTPSSTWSRFRAPAKTRTRSACAPPNPSCARAAASANASTPSSCVARPVAIRALMLSTLRHPQLALVGRRPGVLAHQLPEAPRGARSVAAAVVVELHVHGGGLLGHRLHPPSDLAQLVVAVVPPE